MYKALSAVSFTAAVLFAGCSANGQVSPATVVTNAMPQGTPLPAPPREPRPLGWLSPELRKAAKGPVLYAVDKADSEILIYPESGGEQAPIGMITSGISNPWGLCVDRNGNLYVANQGDGTNGTVTVYPRGSISPSLTYSQGLSRPLYPIVDHKGDLFVGNGAPQGGTIVEYLAGSTNAYQVLQTGGAEVDGMGFDSRGNLYAAFRNRLATSVMMFAPGTTEGQSLGMPLTEPQGLIVDKRGDIVVAESILESVIGFRPGTETPAFRANLPIQSGNASQLSMTEKEDQLFAATEGGFVYVRSYPGMKATTWTVVDQGFRSLEGIALSNGQVF